MTNSVFVMLALAMAVHMGLTLDLYVRVRTLEDRLEMKDLRKKAEASPPPSEYFDGDMAKPW